MNDDLPRFNSHLYPSPGPWITRYMTREQYIKEYAPSVPAEGSVGMRWQDEVGNITLEVIFTDNHAVEILESWYKLQDTRGI